MTGERVRERIEGYLNRVVFSENEMGGRPHLLKILQKRGYDPKEVLHNILKWGLLETDGRISYVTRKIKEEYGIKTSYHTVWRLLKNFEDIKEEVRKYIEAIEEDWEAKDFRSLPEIRKWEERIRESGSLSALRHIRVMERILKGKVVPTFKCSPKNFNLEEARRFVREYNKTFNTIKVPERFRKAIRHFLMNAKGIPLPRGMGKSYGLGGEKDSYGKYSHIRLNEEQIKAIESFLKERDYKTYLVFKLGIETCSRAFALISIPREKLRKENYNGKEIYILDVFEPKVKSGHIEQFLGYWGKWWRKYISKELYEELEGWKCLHEDWEGLFVKELSVGEVKKETNRVRKILKEAYKHIGIEEPYFYKMPLHALRHVGAIRWLEKTGWNYNLVAKIGGWGSVQTLIDFYGALSERVIIEAVYGK
ncbi:MAG: hypothetical protein DRN03_05260 [Thermoplasmata archaeon]|nr:MAG: hypothetical protein DRN03_05260 [Thermoplasmata archaeon]